MLITVLAIGLGTRAVSEAVTILSGPSFTKAPMAPLAGRLRLATDVPSRVSVSVSDGVENRERNFYDYGTTHFVSLFGFKPGRETKVCNSYFDSKRPFIVDR